MSDRRAPVKIALLTLPLLVSVLALHAWGDAMAGGLGRAVGNWQYPERSHGPFLIRAPRRSDVDVFASKTLEEFVLQAVKQYGVPLAIQVPAPPVTVVLLGPDAELERFNCTVASELNPNEGVFDPIRRTIFVRMERKLQQEPMIAALRQAAARALLHDAGSARWSPWMAEGLVGRLEGTRPAEYRTLTGELGLEEILKLTEADFRGHNRAAAVRSARLLAAFLMERLPGKFDTYYKEERAGLHPSFSERLGEPRALEEEWKDWLQRLK